MLKRGQCFGLEGPRHSRRNKDEAQELQEVTSGQIKSHLYHWRNEGKKFLKSFYCPACKAKSCLIFFGGLCSRSDTCVEVDCAKLEGTSDQKISVGHHRGLRQVMRSATVREQALRFGH